MTVTLSCHYLLTKMPPILLRSPSMLRRSLRHGRLRSALHRGFWLWSFSGMLLNLRMVVGQYRLTLE